MVLEYGLKDSPCSTQWIDVRYKCTKDLVWTSMEPLHRYVCLYKCTRNCSFKTDIKACLPLFGNAHKAMEGFVRITKQSLPL